MTQMSNSQVRVVDPVLTEVARGYRNAAYVGTYLFPYVPVPARGGKIIQFGKESFRLYQTARTPGSDVAVAQFGYAGAPYGLTNHALSGLVPVEHMEEAEAVPGIDLGSGAVTFARDIIDLRLEVEQAGVARDASNYASTNKVALSGTDQWSDEGSDPIALVEDYKEVIRQQTGIRPNTMVLGAAVFSKLKVHPKILERIKYTGRDVATEDLLASLFGLARVASGDAVYMDADGTMQDVWGKDAVMSYTNLASMANMGAPTYGYTYRLRNYPVAEVPWLDRSKESWLYPVKDAVSAVIAGADAGVLIQDAVA